MQLCSLANRALAARAMTRWQRLRWAESQGFPVPRPVAAGQFVGLVLATVTGTPGVMWMHPFREDAFSLPRDVAVSVMLPMPTEWWLRPVSMACRVGAHRAVVWNRLYFNPRLASRSSVGSHSSQRGRYQFHSPSSFIMLGRTTDRMIVASARSATATPKPICWNMTRSPDAKPANTATMISAAPVMIPAVVLSP